MKKIATGILSFFLAAVLLLGGTAGILATALEGGDAPESHLLVHYDFEGNTPAERLANKAPDTTTGALTLAGTAGMTYVADGVAHIDSASKNYLTASLGSAVQSAEALTVVTRVRITGDNPMNLVELAIVGSAVEPSQTLRWSANVNNSIVANGFSGVGVSSGNFVTGQWLNLAVSLSYAGGNATVKTFSSADGKTWTQTGTRTLATANQIPNAKSLLLGKIATGIDDRGRSFDFDDFRIYGADLTAEDLGGLDLTDLLAVYDFENGTTGGLSVIKATVADGSATVPTDGKLYTMALNNAVKAANALTVWMEFRADYVLNSPAWHDLLNIPGVARISVMPATGVFVTVGSFTKTALSTDPLCDTDSGNAAFSGNTIRLAYAVDGSAKTVTLSWSADGGATWKSRTSEFTGDLSQTDGVSFGANLDRGLSLQFNEIRLYGAALNADAIQAIEPVRTERRSDAALTLHYDFIGSTEEEKLTDKVSGGNKLSFVNSGDSYIRSGEAHLDAAAGNSLSVVLPAGTNLGGADGMTVLTSFRVDKADAGQGWQPVLRLDGTVMLAVNPKGKTLATAAGGALGAGAANWATSKTWTAQTWITAAAVLRTTADGVQETLYLTYDNGVNWYRVSAGFDGQSLTQSQKTLILGKNGTTLAGNASFTYRDLRVYNAPLSLGQIRDVTPDRSPDLTVAEVVAGEDLSVRFSVPETALADYTSVTAHAAFRGRTVELEGRSDGTMRTFAWTELTTLTLSDPISVTLTAQTGDGRILHGETVTISSREAVLNLLNREETSSAEKRWCVDLLRYAAAVQVYFGYQTDALATDGLTEEQLAQGGSGRTALDVLDAGYTLVPDDDFCAVIKGATLSLTFATRLDLFVKIGAGVEKADLTVVICDADGNRIDTLSPADAEANADGTYTVGTRAVGDGNYAKELYITVYENFGAEGERAVSDTVRYSIESYIARSLVGKDNALAAAMLNWSDAICALRT